MKGVFGDVQALADAIKSSTTLHHLNLSGMDYLL